MDRILRDMYREMCNEYRQNLARPIVMTVPYQVYRNTAFRRYIDGTWIPGGTYTRQEENQTMALQPTDADKVNGDGQLEFPNVGDPETPLGITVRQALNVLVDEISKRAQSKVEKLCADAVQGLGDRLQPSRRQIQSDIQDEIEHYIDRYVHIPSDDWIQDTAYEQAESVFDLMRGRMQDEIEQEVKEYFDSKTEMPSLNDIADVRVQLQEANRLVDYLRGAASLKQILTRFDEVGLRLASLESGLKDARTDRANIRRQAEIAEVQGIEADTKAQSALEVLTQIRDLLNGQIVTPLGGDGDEGTDEADQGSEVTAE